MTLETGLPPKDFFQRDLSENGRVNAIFKYISKEGQDLSILDSKRLKQELEVFLDNVSKYYDISDPFVLAEKCKEIADKGFTTEPFNDEPYEIKIDNDGRISIRGVDPESLTNAFESSYKRDKFGNIYKEYLIHTGYGKGEFHWSTFYRDTNVMWEDEYGTCYSVCRFGERWWTDSTRTQALAFSFPSNDLKVYLQDFPPIVPYCLLSIGRGTLAIRNPEDPTSLSNATILGENIPLSEIPDLIKKLPQDHIQRLVENPDLNEYYLGLNIRETLTEASDTSKYTELPNGSRGNPETKGIHK